MILQRMRTLSVFTAGLAAAATPSVTMAHTPQQEVRDRLGAVGRADTTTALALSAAFRSAAGRTLPAVVFISVEQKPQAQARPDQVPPSLRDFFGGADGPQPPQQGTGSGFIIDTLGHILTNNHVVADASRLTVRLVDGREYAARIVGADVSTDIAVIRIDMKPGETVPTAPLGESDGLRVGDWVLALGNPLGLDFSVTAGIVSAKGRQMPGASDALESFIQTDAAINPGNSGGPLIDLFGRVVGVNSAIFGSTRFVGYGFAVPISIARRVMADLLEFGYLRRPRVGISIRPVQAVDAEIKLSEVRGALISAVEPAGPGSQAGLAAGDVVVAVNGNKIRDDADLITRLAAMHPSEQVTLGIMRDGKPSSISLRLGEFPRPPRVVTPPAPDTAPRHEQVLGFSVRDLTPTDISRLRYTGKGGVLLDAVPAYSIYLAERGIRAGLILLGINGKAVNSAEDVRRITQDIKPGSAVSLRFYDPEMNVVVVNYRTREGG